ncbi:MAG: polysaccharide deacetylase family protein [Gaiellaceae bacterium]
MAGKAALRRTVASAARTAAFARFVAVLEQMARPRPHVLPVLTYHRVDEPTRSPLLYPGLISATPAEFEEQMRFLASSYRPVALTELLAVRRGEARLPLRSVLVTFDDAYRDFGEQAWPAMRRYGIPVTLFVATAYPGEPEKAFWWDRLYSALMSADSSAPVATPAGDLSLVSGTDRLRAFRRLRNYLKSAPHDRAMEIVEELSAGLAPPSPSPAVLSWEELRALAAHGVALAPHSRTHPLLDRLPLEEAREEIVGSLDDLEREIGSAPRVFAYPGGGVNGDVIAVLAEERFELAFLARRGSNDLRRADWLRLRRINVGRASGLPLIRAQLLPWWTHTRR